MRSLRELFTKIKEDYFPAAAGKAVKIANKQEVEKQDLTLTDLILYLSLDFGLIINGAFGIMKFVIGMILHSSWFIMVGIYYVILAGMRFWLFIRSRRSDKKAGTYWKRRYELKSYLFCGFMLLGLTVILVCFGVPMIYDDEHWNLPKICIDCFVFYAIYTFVTAVINMIRFFKNQNPILSAATQVSMVTALVAVFSLQSSILKRFGYFLPPLAIMFLNSLTGSIVAFLIFVIAIVMIVRATFQLYFERREYFANLGVPLEAAVEITEE